MTWICNRFWDIIDFFFRTTYSVTKGDKCNDVIVIHKLAGYRPDILDGTLENKGASGFVCRFTGRDNVDRSVTLGPNYYFEMRGEMRTVYARENETAAYTSPFSLHKRQEGQVMTSDAFNYILDTKMSADAVKAVTERDSLPWKWIIILAIIVSVVVCVYFVMNSGDDGGAPVPQGQTTYEQINGVWYKFIDNTYVDTVDESEVPLEFRQ